MAVVDKEDPLKVRDGISLSSNHLGTLAVFSIVEVHETKTHTESGNEFVRARITCTVIVFVWETDLLIVFVVVLFCLPRTKMPMEFNSSTTAVLGWLILEAKDDRDPLPCLSRVSPPLTVAIINLPQH
jgi:hypothetical protein